MIPLQQQIDDYLRHADEAIDLVIAYLQTHRDVVKRRAVLRLSTAGARDYGDDSWRKSAEALALETLDEWADGTVYPSIAIGIHGLATTLVSLGIEDGEA